VSGAAGVLEIDEAAFVSRMLRGAAFVLSKRDQAFMEKYGDALICTIPL